MSCLQISMIIKSYQVQLRMPYLSQLCQITIDQNFLGEVA